MTKKHEQEGIDLGHLFRCDGCGAACEVELMKECMGEKFCPGCWEDLDHDDELPCQGVTGAHTSFEEGLGHKISLRDKCLLPTTARLNGDIPCCEECFEKNRIFQV